MLLPIEDVCIDFIDDLHTFANFLELFTFMICLPVYIYVDIFELMNSLWVQWDEQMRTSIVRNASLLTDLALVRVVLSDKTGTITSGKKTVQQFAILDSLGWDVLDTQTLVGELRDQSRQVQINSRAEFYRSSCLVHIVLVQVTNTLLYFLYSLAACNSVEVKQKEDQSEGNQNEYSFVSRDELAFVRCCESIGCALKSTSGALTLKTVCTALPLVATL